MDLSYLLVQEVPVYSIDDSHLIDDSTDIVPMDGLSRPTSLRQRTLDRLSTLMGVSTTAAENENTRTLNIFLTRQAQSVHSRLERDGQLQTLLKSIEEYVSLIAVHKSGPPCARASEALWDTILIYVYPSIKKTVDGLRELFTKYSEVYEDLVTTLFNINNLDKSTYDTELLESIVSLSQVTWGYNSSMRDSNELIQSALTMANAINHLLTRLTMLLQRSKFASELHKYIYILSMPARTYHTLVREAKTLCSFEEVKFHIKPTASPMQEKSAEKSFVKIKQLTPKATITTVETPSTTSQKNVKQIVQSAAATKPQLVRDLMESVHKYLSLEDRGRGLTLLQPKAKQETVQLIGTILNGMVPPTHTDIWHSFGFVTAASNTETQHLCGLYSVLLTSSPSPQKIFQDLLHALETNTLPALFDTHQGPQVRKIIPNLEHFLSTPPNQRPTVWRLKQFVHFRESHEPPACLRRDYGFNFCQQRDEVERLKTIYTAMLEHMAPLDIHSASVHGRLYETAVRKGVSIDAKDKRLMQNDFPSPFVGLDDEQGLERYQRMLFKKA